jgi:hypothetical protein
MYMFSNFQRAEIGPPRLPQLVDGFEGVLKIEKTYVNPTRFGDKFFCEMTVGSSNRPQNPVGQRVIWKQDLTKKDVAENAVFQWAAAVLGVDRENEPAVAALRQQMPQLFGYAVEAQEQNTFTQRYVAVRARDTTTKNSRPFTAYDFFPLPTNGG